METRLFVAADPPAALHSNQKLSARLGGEGTGVLLMTASNCLTNSQRYSRATVK